MRLDRWTLGVVFVWAIVLVAVCVRSGVLGRERSLYLTWATAGQDWASASPLLYQHKEGDGLDIFRYSPLVAALLTPLQLFDERTGSVLWLALNAGVFLGGLWYWLRDRLPTGGQLRGVLFLLAMPLALNSLANGQPNPLVIGLLLFAVAFAGDSRWTLAAVCIALACALKIYPIAVGLLLVVVFPRQMAWRLALALLAVLLLPYFCQRPEYVTEQYIQWFERLQGDDRSNIALERAYRDLWLLIRVGKVPIGTQGYLGIQLGTAAGCAVLCVVARWAGFAKTQLLTTVLALGTCWMMLCGPATESASFVQLAPALAWAVVSACRDRWPLVLRWLPVVSFALFMVGVLAGLTTFTAKIHALGVQPLATLVLSLAYVSSTLHALLTRKPLAALQKSATAQAA
jgi:Glycosyltransferase family 87